MSVIAGRLTMRAFSGALCCRASPARSPSSSADWPTKRMLNLHKLVRDALLDDATHSPTLTPRLALALEDTSPPVRRWAGRTALAVVPQHELEPLLRLLADNRSPSLRLLALREYRRRADADRIEAACLDGNANVRFYARRYLRKLHRRVDQRDHALAILASSAGQTAQLVGALAVLSEFGREQDRPLLETFVRDKRARVAAEAARTLRLLG
ncbi:hypothetical protein [Sorangium sp. So ce341]|uniref:hypothetical protein n=1 Tax=Sorangium sp. So ce341 TaxID=3133302 RepID=UPI003F5F24F6